jgi:hypothetical protein
LSHYLNELPETVSERVLAAMREIRAKADVFAKQHDRLRPPPGTIAAGGAHIDPFARSEGLYSFLSALSRGLLPDAACQYGKKEAAACYLAWNKSRPRDYQTHYWEHAADPVIEDAWRQILRAEGGEG